MRKKQKIKTSTNRSKDLLIRLIAGLICCVIMFSCSTSADLPFVNSVSDLISGKAQGIPGTDSYFVSGTTGDYVFLTGVGGVMELRDPTGGEIFVIIPKEKYKSFAQGKTVTLQLKPLLRANVEANLINTNFNIFIIN